MIPRLTFVMFLSAVAGSASTVSAQSFVGLSVTPRHYEGGPRSPQSGGIRAAPVNVKEYALAIHLMTIHTMQIAVEGSLFSGDFGARGDEAHFILRDQLDGGAIKLRLTSAPIWHRGETTLGVAVEPGVEIIGIGPYRNRTHLAIAAGLPFTVPLSDHLRVVFTPVIGTQTERLVRDAEVDAGFTNANHWWYALRLGVSWGR